MTFTSPISLLLAVLITISLFVAAWLRRPALPRLSMLFIGCGILALMLATGGISCRRGHEPAIAVMIDCSPSTRGASFRDVKWVRSRVRELIGDRPYELYGFSNITRQLNDDDPIEEMPADWTTLAPPAVDRVLLFSDGRFDAPPTTPPIDVVIDPALSSPADASVADLEARVDEVVATIHNSGPPRELTWENSHRHSTTAPTGSTVIRAEGDKAPLTETLTAHLSQHDLWPENDSLSIRPSPPMASQRWWVGSPVPTGWMQLPPENLPLESSAWVGPAIVVLDDVSADQLSPQQQDRLTQYVRDLGGALVITGGEHAFAAGHYAGSALELLSPLSSSPPEPVNHWVLLVDSSGSMSAPAGNESRFGRASEALVSVLRDLPKSDLVSIGSFARDLHWWSMAKKAQDSLLLKLPPTDVSPSGPTNLEAALEQIVASQASAPPIEMLVITDAQAKFNDPTKLADDLKSHHIRVNALLVGEATADSPFQNLINSTGGKFAAESDPQKWTATVRQMLRAAMPDDLIRASMPIAFTSVLQSIPSRTVQPINQTWLKQSATLIATATRDKETLPAAARWSVGTGEVVAVAFHPTDDEILAIERAVARRPRDPRFKISWHNGATLPIRIDAVDRDTFLNNEPLTLDLTSAPRQPIPQSAPGRYEIDLPAPRSPATATIYHDQQVLDRFALAGRYPREFDAIGNDVDALRALANRSGGSVIQPDRHSAIEIPETREITSIAAPMAILGFVLIGLGLVAWRLF